MAAAAPWPMASAAPTLARVVGARGDDEMRRVLRSVLDRPGRRVEWISEARDASSVADGCDLVVLAGSGPGFDPHAVLDAVRAASRVPVVVVTRRATEAERILAYERGADDVIPLPCSTRELAVRLAAAIRRHRPIGEGRVVHGRMVLDVDGRHVSVGGRSVALTRREFDLLVCLARRPRRAFSREELLHEVWASSAAWQSAATVTEHVRRVRRKLESAGAAVPVITTVHGIGYRLDLPA